MKGFYTVYHNIERWTAEGTIGDKFNPNTADRYAVEVLTGETPFVIAMDFASREIAAAYMTAFYPKVKKESYEHFQAMVRNHYVRKGLLDNMPGHGG